MEVFSFCRGYDAEYEFRIAFYRNGIDWHLQFDPQWSDPPRDAWQSLEDFLERGAPGDFGLYGEEESFRALARALLGRAQ